MILRTVSGILTVRIILAIMVQPVENMVYIPPYTPDPEGSCRNLTAEYYNTDVNLCCSKCTSGTRRKVECSSTSDTACEPCPHGQYSGNMNYFPNCFRCPKCSADKGLQYIQMCSSTTKTQCGCQTGMYCVLDQHPECKECASYTDCEPGHGVSVEGTAESDVECAPCPNGTFSDQHSYTQICQHHRDCVSQGRDVLTYGNATSDAVCGLKVSRPLVSNLHTTTPPSPPTTVPRSGKGHTTPSLQSKHMSTLPTAPGSKLTPSPSDPMVIAPTEEKSPGFDLGIAAGAIGGVLFLLLIVGTIIYKKAYTESICVSSTEDINGNSEKDAIKFDCGVPMDLQNRSFITTFQEQQRLLGKGDCSNASQAEIQQDASRTWCFNSLEDLSIGPIQSNLPQPSIQANTPQPSPQYTSPMASIPLVNVNITVTYPVNTGNGLCSTPTSTHLDSPQADPEAPLSREEEEVYVNMPQQEGGKEALKAVQEIGNDV